MCGTFVLPSMSSLSLHVVAWASSWHGSFRGEKLLPWRLASKGEEVYAPCFKAARCLQGQGMAQQFSGLGKSSSPVVEDLLGSDSGKNPGRKGGREEEDYKEVPSAAAKGPRG